MSKRSKTRTAAVDEDSDAGRRAEEAAKALTDADFKRFVLYTKEGHGGSDRALDALRGHAEMRRDTWTQDVDELPERPSWLVTVPTLVDKERRRVYRGLRTTLKAISHTRVASGINSKKRGKGISSSSLSDPATYDDWDE